MNEIEILQSELTNNQIPLHCTRKELCDAVDLAIEVLQEKVEREKGCEYCDFSSGDTGGIINNVGDSFVMIKSENSISIATDDCLFKMLKLSYCPMCGRKLVEE